MNLTYDALNKSLEQDMKSIYLLYGEEEYLIEMFLKKIKKKMGELILGINYVLIDENNVNNLIPEIQMPAFGYDKKLIIVKKSGVLKKDGRKKNATPIQEKIANFIKDEFEIINESCIIIFLEKEIDKNIVFNEINNKGVVCEVEELKQHQLVAKLKKICELYKVNCEDSTLNYLIEMSGTSLHILINEIRKLIEYVGENGTIKTQDVNSLALKQIDSVIFELTDNIAVRKIDKSLEVLDNLIYQKEPLQKILITLYNHFKKLYLCSLAISLNKEIVSTLNLKPNQSFLISKYKKQSSYFKQEELRKILKEFIELDYNSKNGKVDIDIGLRSILCNYCN